MAALGHSLHTHTQRVAFSLVNQLSVPIASPSPYLHRPGKSAKSTAEFMTLHASGWCSASLSVLSFIMLLINGADLRNLNPRLTLRHIHGDLHIALLGLDLTMLRFQCLSIGLHVGAPVAVQLAGVKVAIVFLCSRAVAWPERLLPCKGYSHPPP